VSTAGASEIHRQTQLLFTYNSTRSDTDTTDTTTRRRRRRR